MYLTVSYEFKKKKKKKKKWIMSLPNSHNPSSQKWQREGNSTMEDRR